MSTNQKPDPRDLNAAIRAALTPSRGFTVTQDGRSGHVTTTTADGETFEGRDGINDALHRYLSGAEPRNRRDEPGEPT